MIDMAKEGRSALTQREYDIFMMHYQDNKTYREIGEKYGLGAERIRQLVAKAQLKIRGYYRKKERKRGKTMSDFNDSTLQFHCLKIKFEYYEKILLGLKTFELRKNDRDYRVGDLIRFVVILDDGNLEDDNSNTFVITYILKDCPEYGLDKDYVILGIQPADEELVHLKVKQRLENEWEKHHEEIKERTNGSRLESFLKLFARSQE